MNGCIQIILIQVKDLIYGTAYGISDLLYRVTTSSVRKKLPKKYLYYI